MAKGVHGIARPEYDGIGVDLSLVSNKAENLPCLKSPDLIKLLASFPPTIQPGNVQPTHFRDLDAQLQSRQYTKFSQFTFTQSVKDVDRRARQRVRRSHPCRRWHRYHCMQIHLRSSGHLVLEERLKDGTTNNVFIGRQVEHPHQGRQRP